MAKKHFDSRKRKIFKNMKAVKIDRIKFVNLKDATQPKPIKLKNCEGKIKIGPHDK